MTNLSDSQLVESYKFWDVVALWGRERLDHDVVVARELAKGIITEGLRFQSFDPKFMGAAEELRSYPYVGYSAYQDTPPIIIRAQVLQHLLAVMHETKDPVKHKIQEEYVTKGDFRIWLVKSGRSLPKFWYADDERVQ